MRLLLVKQDGAKVLMPTPTIEQLVKHAERFGTHMVPQTACDLGFGLDAVTRLITQCDRVDQEHAKTKKPWAPAFYSKPKQAPETRAKKLLGITDEDEEKKAA